MSIQSDGAGRALDGVRVVDLACILAGPLCTQILADHGADVIKVEPPDGDETRRWGPPFDGDTAAYFLAVNRGKRSVVIDLTTAEGVAQLHGLLAGADILVENLRPGRLARWGVGDDAALRARYPRLIHCHISGFGAAGPMAGMAGYDAALQAMTGLMSINGAADGPPTRIGVPVVDLATGANATIGILLALAEREISGQGQKIEVSLFDSGIALMHPHLANYLHSEVPPRRSGNAHPNITPYDTFATATGAVFLAVGGDDQFRRLCDCLAMPELAQDPAFASNAARCKNRDKLTEVLTRAFSRLEAEALVEQLAALGVPCAPVLTLPQALAHPHTAHSGMIIDVEGQPGCASPIRLSRTPAHYRQRPPMIDEHRAEILGEPSQFQQGRK
jgi:crotonobetainyl-CoA:carnitine CoA-transferase CaiB-like acyl-CoA transferase